MTCGTMMMIDDVALRTANHRKAGGGQESRTSEEEQRWPVAMRLGGALAGAMRGLASRIGGAWGAIRAGKRRREEGVREDDMDKRRRTGDG